MKTNAGTYIAISILLICLLTIASAAVSCSQTASGATVIDDQNREVTLEGIPARIVSHVPSITETLFALSLGDSVVGVSDYCNFPEEAAEKSSVGGYYTPSIEMITALDPDLVLTDGYAEDIFQLEGMGIPYIVLDPKDIDGITGNIRLLGEVTETQDKANELIKGMEERIDAVVTAVKGAASTRVFYVFDASDPTKPWTAGPGSFMDTLINLCGGENVAAEAQGPWIQLSMEELIDSDPEIIVVDSMHGTATMSPSEIKSLTIWESITAVREDRISIIDGDLVNRHGPRIVDGLEELARIIHPELFGE